MVAHPDWQSDDVVRVPLGALFRRGSDWTVYRVVDGAPRLTPVDDRPPQQPSSPRCSSGLSAGDAVVLHPSDRVTDGVGVRRGKTDRANRGPSSAEAVDARGRVVEHIGLIGRRIAADGIAVAPQKRAIGRSTVSRSGSSSRTGSGRRRTSATVSSTIQAMWSGSLRWMKVPRPDSFDDDVRLCAPAGACPRRHASRPSSDRSSSMPACWRMKVVCGKSCGEPRGAVHLRREDLKIEATGRSRQAPRSSAGSVGSSARSARVAKRYCGFSCQWSCMRTPRSSG